MELILWMTKKVTSMSLMLLHKSLSCHIYSWTRKETNKTSKLSAMFMASVGHLEVATLKTHQFVAV
ncbi:hypothetical protein SCA6_002633 [Theobroma cacao]